MAQEKAPSTPAAKPSTEQVKPGAAPATKGAPKPAPKTSRKPAAAEVKSSEGGSDGERALQEIYSCVAQGLPDGWKRAWVTVSELSGDGKERTFEGRFQVSMDASGDQRWDFVPCNTREVAEGVYRLNEFLEPEKRAWKVATLLFLSDGKFELKYDYTR